MRNEFDNRGKVQDDILQVQDGNEHKNPKKVLTRRIFCDILFSNEVV
ncbi:hypothetical protein FWF64_01110 [Candidatus Saccharibacteria bacterium]|nr:hypothetical protein [Candidatus Saccharibacteria bacterium]